MIFLRNNYKSLKRIIDLAFSLFLLSCLSPIIFIISLLVFLDTKNLPIYTQKRLGKCKKEFTIFKFRTMRKLNDGQYHLTDFGDFLRKSSLDEIPQLFNILIGEMSFVGPRPLLESDFKLHLNETTYFDLLPGITGLAQVNGRKDLNLDKKFFYNHLYKENISFKLDCQIISRTIELLIDDNLMNFCNYFRRP